MRAIFAVGAIAAALLAPGAAAASTQIGAPNAALAGLVDRQAVYYDSGSVWAQGADGPTRLLIKDSPRLSVVWVSRHHLLGHAVVDFEEDPDELWFHATPLPGGAAITAPGLPVCFEAACDLTDRRGALWACAGYRYLAPVAVDGDVAVIADPAGCRPNAPLLLFDLAAGGTPLPSSIVPPARVRALALAGGALAYATSMGVAVVDRTTGAAITQPVLPAGARPGSLAVASDGTLAVVTGPREITGPCRKREAWLYPPGATQGTRLARKVCDFGIDLAGHDALVIRRRAGDRAELVRLPADGATATVAHMIIGPHERDGDGLSPRFFTDDTTVAYEALGCSPAAKIILQPLAEPAAPPGPSGCPVRISRVKIVGRGAKRRLRTTISCPNGCEGSYVWQATKLSDRRFRRSDYDDEVKLRLRPGQRRRVSWDMRTELSELGIGPRCSRPGRRVRLTVSAANSEGAWATAAVRCSGRGRTEPIVDE